MTTCLWAAGCATLLRLRVNAWRCLHASTDCEDVMIPRWWVFSGKVLPQLEVPGFNP